LNIENFSKKLIPSTWAMRPSTWAMRRREGKKGRKAGGTRCKVINNNFKKSFFEVTTRLTNFFKLFAKK
jgi:hypothetical protein